MSSSDEQYNLCDKADDQKKVGPAETSQKLKVTVKVTSKGFMLAYGDRAIGPFRYRNEVEEVEVAAKLSGLGPVDVEEWNREVRENLEKWIVQPKDVAVAKLDAAWCIPYEPPQTLKAEEEPIETQVSKLNAELVGKTVTLNGQIVSEQSQKAVPQTLQIYCIKCHSDMEADLTKNESKDLLKPLVFKEGEALIREARTMFTGKYGKVCSAGGEHRVEHEEEGFTDYAVLGVRDLLEEIKKFDRQVYQSRRVHLVGVKVPASKKVRLHGYVVVEPSSRDLCILADGVEPLETQVAGFSITDEDTAEWPKWFNGRLDIATQIAPDMVGRELVQRAYLLGLHSVPEIPDIHGRIIRGCLRILCFGDTKTNKTESAKDLTDGHYHLGGFIVAESSSRTGITYTIDNENKAIVWGELPNNDLGLTVIDGLHSMFGEEMKELRESLENQRIIVRRAMSGEALARTRVIGIFNPRKPMNEYMYPCMAVNDSLAFYDPPDLTRWDIFLPFGDADVPKEDIASRSPQARPVPEDLFKRHVYWSWSRRPEDVIYVEAAKQRIVEAAIELMAEYTLSSTPIVHNGVRDVLCRLSVAQACLTHSTDEIHTKVLVDVSHVEAALEFYRETLNQLGLREYKLETEGRLKITPSELEQIVRDLGPTEMDILNAIRTRGKSSVVLAEELDLADKTIKHHYEPLRRHDLIAARPKVGVTLTARGVQFLKALTNGLSGTKNVPISQKAESIGTENVPNRPLLKAGGTPPQPLSVEDKLKIVHEKAWKLAKDRMVSKFVLADALQPELKREEVFRLLDELEWRRRVTKWGSDDYLVEEP